MTSSSILINNRLVRCFIRRHFTQYFFEHFVEVSFNELSTSIRLISRNHPGLKKPTNLPSPGLIKPIAKNSFVRELILLKIELLYIAELLPKNQD